MKSLSKLIALYCCTLLIFFGCTTNKLKPNGTISESEILQIAKSITVKLSIPSASVSGSGVIIKKDQDDYWILTNEHVVEASLKKQLWVQTPDGKAYAAKYIQYPFVKDDDLALVKFAAKEQYFISHLGNFINIKVGDNLYSVGFPNDNEDSQVRLKLTKGVASMITKPLIGGYQIGYTNDVDRGMSGGPILNQQGEVIGVNGIRKNPSLGDPFKFVDGSTISEQLWKQMHGLSWGIPIDRFTKIEEAYIKF